VFVSGSGQADTLAENHLEQYLTAELVRNIGESNKLCTLDDMVSMGLQAGPGLLGQLTASAIPLAQQLGAKGFILLYRKKEAVFSSVELDYISSITPGLSKAVNACLVKTNNR